MHQTSAQSNTPFLQASKPLFPPVHRIDLVFLKVTRIADWVLGLFYFQQLQALLVVMLQWTSVC